MDGARATQMPGWSDPNEPVGGKPVGWQSRSGPCFGEFAKQWLECACVAWKPSQLETVQSILRAHLIPAFGERSIPSIVRQDVLSFRACLIRTTPGRQGRAQLSAACANRVLSVLRQILLEAKAQYAIPAATQEVPALPVRRSAIQPFTWAQVEHLVAAAPPPWQNYVLARCLTGLRSGEINGLRWDQVDLTRGVLSIRCARVRGRQVLPKTEYSERDLPIGAQLLQVTTPLLSRMQGQVVCANIGDGKSAHPGVDRTVFPDCLAPEPALDGEFHVRICLAGLALAGLRHRGLAVPVVGWCRYDQGSRRRKRMMIIRTRCRPSIFVNSMFRLSTRNWMRAGKSVR